MLRPASPTTVYRAFVATVEAHRDRPFLRAPAGAYGASQDQPVEYSYAQTLDLVEGLRASYLGQGVVPGSRVAAAFDNRLEVYLNLLALNALGASLVPLNMDGSNAELLHVLRHSESGFLAALDIHMPRLQGLLAESGGIVVLDPVPQDVQWLDQPPQGDETTETALLYTSGTTGQPKGCMLSNQYFLTVGTEYNRLGGLCAINEHDRLLTPLPPNHMNALAVSFMAMMLCGGCVIQLDRFHPHAWWQTVRDESATVIHYLGVMPAILLKLPEQDDSAIGEHVRFGFGAGCDPSHQQVFEDRFGFPLVEAWAMTETGAGAMIVAHQEPRHVGQRCFGRPDPHIEIRLVDEQDQVVPVGRDGELLVRRAGPEPRHGFFSGYYRDQEATEAGWKDGWWHTGDVVRQGSDGSLFFVDRRKNVIRRSGENIAAVEVEAALLKFERVGNCAVTAVPDEIRGDEVFAFLVATDETEDPGELARAAFDFCMQQLVYFKAPGYVTVVSQLPLTASQKIARGEVKRQARESLQAGAVHDFRALKKRSGAQT